MKKENFNFEKYLIEKLGCKYSEDYHNRLDHDDSLNYIFIEGGRFMLFDRGDESGWIDQVPSDEDDPVIDRLIEILD